MSIRPLSNQIYLKPREDLEDNWATVIRVNKITGLVQPRPVFGEVLGVGPGDQLHPDIPDLRVGDLVVWDLSKIGPPVIYHGAPVFLNSFNCLLARLENPKTNDEKVIALLDMVLTEYSPIAAKAAVSGLIELTDVTLRDGMQESSKESPVTTVWERVVNAGRGITFAGRSTCARCKCELQRTEVPDVKPRDLVCFNPAHSIEWRRRGRHLRFTPFSELRGVEE